MAVVIQPCHELLHTRINDELRIRYGCLAVGLAGSGHVSQIIHGVQVDVRQRFSFLLHIVPALRQIHDVRKAKEQTRQCRAQERLTTSQYEVLN